MSAYSKSQGGSGQPHYVPCPSPGIMHNGAHLTHIPASLRGTDLQSFDHIRELGLMCPTCEGNGMVLSDELPQ